MYVIYILSYAHIYTVKPIIASAAAKPTPIDFCDLNLFSVKICFFCTFKEAALMFNFVLWHLDTSVSRIMGIVCTKRCQLSKCHDCSLLYDSAGVTSLP